MPDLTASAAVWRAVAAPIAAPVMLSSVISAPVSVRTTAPREKTSTRSQRPCSSTASDDRTMTPAPLFGDVAEDSVELEPRAGVDAAGRLVGEKHRRIPGHRAGEQHLLLVAAGKMRDALLGRPRLDRQRLDLALDEVGLAATRDEAEARQHVEHQRRQVLADRQRQEQPFGVAIAGQVDDAAFLGADRVGKRHAPLADRQLARARARGRRGCGGTRAGRCPRRRRGRRPRRAAPRSRRPAGCGW